MGEDKKDLKHYGILGMKWGVRRDLGPDGRIKESRQEKKARRSEAVTKAEKTSRGKEIKNQIGTIGVKRMSDLENKGYSKKAALKRVRAEKMVADTMLILGSAVVIGKVSNLESAMSFGKRETNEALKAIGSSPIIGAFENGKWKAYK